MDNKNRLLPFASMFLTFLHSAVRQPYMDSTPQRKEFSQILIILLIGVDINIEKLGHTTNIRKTFS